jgi:phosphate transport system substrate-binding protein
MKLNFLIISILIGGIFTACKDSSQKTVPADNPNDGTIYISVDESFKPAIEQQILVYQSSSPNAKIIASYKSEVDCFKDLQKDSTRMILVARGLNKLEEDYFTTNLGFKPEDDIVAYDAVAIIVNINSTDTLFTIDKIKKLLNGKTNAPVIMDGNNATSTVRFLQDSVLRGEPFGRNVVAANGSEAVVETVAKTPNAIGFVGLSWVGNNNEPKQQEQLKKIKLALVECVKCAEKELFAKPSQSTITFSQYPLARPLYFVLKENYLGLGTGFKNFMNLERGQLIFRRSFLAPAKMDFKKRGGLIKDSDN